MRNILRRQARRRGSVEFYREDFPASAAAFRAFVRGCDLPKRTPPVTPVGIVIVPWVGTPAPWYSIALAIGLIQRGRQVLLIWDDTSFPDVPGPLEVQNRKIGEVLAEFDAHFNWVRLSAERVYPPSLADEARLHELAKQNVTWILRGRPPVESDQALAKECRESLRASLALIRTLLRRLSFDSLIVPGGVYSSSCVFMLAGQEKNLRVATYDAGMGWASVCTSGIAAQQQDIPRAFKQVWELESSLRRGMIAAARSEHHRRVEKRDLAEFQTTRAVGMLAPESGSVLIPLNVDFDSAALGRHYLFADTVDWITQTVAFVLQRHSGSVIVRQHPSERRPVERSHLEMAAVLTERFRGEARLRFVAAADRVSTYDLLTSASLVLPFVSTIAMEAAALNKPVLVSGRCYYSDLGFVWSAESRDEYFRLLERGLEGQLAPLPEQVEKAWLCYYLTQVCNRLWTNFTPQPPDFWRWVRRKPLELFSDPAVIDILTALDEARPVSLLRHARLVEKARA